MSVVHVALLERTLRFKEIALVETASAALGIAVTVGAALPAWAPSASCSDRS